MDFYVRKKIVQSFCFVILTLANCLAVAQEIAVFDTVTGAPSVTLAFTTNDVSQKLGVPVTLTSVSTITRVELIRVDSNSSTSFFYEVRNTTSPYALVDSGTPTRVSSTPTPSIHTRAVLDRFTINSSSLAPGNYFVSVSSSGNNDYSLFSGSPTITNALIIGVAPAAIVPVTIMSAVYAQSIATTNTATSVPTATPLALALLGSFLGFAVYRNRKNLKKS